MDKNTEAQPAPRKVDRRILRTRLALRDALMALIHERGYEKITVQDITDRANVARTTFYMHFSDKDDLLFQSMREIYESLIESLTHAEDGLLLQRESDPRDFEHVQRYADFYRVMLSERGSMPFLTRVRDLLAEALSDVILKPLLPQGQTPSMPLPLMGYALAGVQIAVIAWWLKHDNMRTSPQEMARLMGHFCTFGVNWGLGLEPPPT